VIAFGRAQEERCQNAGKEFPMKVRGSELKRQGPADTADSGKVRLGDSSIYFDPSTDKLKRKGPAETADDDKVRLGDSSIYFDASRDR
jgi:hypothetical protein